ncbi:MAG TPA: polysaccharide deacetylase family protein [Anaeromyxobacter sp.]|nr:polysaccharide deacetylase family protein [Anaeromyxobacter sp.]
MRLLFPHTLSRMHLAAAAAAVATLLLLAVRPELWPVPPLALLFAVAAAPYFPGWAFFLPIATHGPRSRPEVALTFDDGPDPRTLFSLLALLAGEGALATFFVVGRRAAAHPEAVRAILSAGHEIGNHSDTHDVFLATRGKARVRDEILGCERALEEHGVRPLAYRPPVGITSPPLGEVLRNLGLFCVAFSCRPFDFGNRRLSGLARRVLRRVRPGDIVLLHDALPLGTPVEEWLREIRAILAGLKERGLRPVALSVLLGERVMEKGERAPRGLGEERGGAAPPAPGGPGRAPSASPSAGARPDFLERASRVLTLLFTLGYPVLVALSLTLLSARKAALILLGVFAAARMKTLRKDLARARGFVALFASVAALLVLAALLDDPRFLLAYPSLVNAALLLHFGWSLRGIPIAERFARMEVKDPSELGEAGVRYCRRVTIVWCGFFALNGGIATALAVFAPRPLWAIYTGGVSYVLIGLVFAVEYVVRKALHGHFGPGAVDRTLARLLGRAEGSP